MPDVELGDPLGRLLILHERTRVGQILKGHPEVAPYRDLVEAAVTNPLEIRFSGSDADCRLWPGTRDIE
jgi:hypothetical protein